MHNPFVNLDKYPRKKLDAMTLEDLLAAQRDCLFPEEREQFDSGDDWSLCFSESDGRQDFFDYTDRLIVRHTLRAEGY